MILCSVHFNVQSEGSVSALGHCTRIKFGIYVHQTLMDTKCEQFYA